MTYFNYYESAVMEALYCVCSLRIPRTDVFSHKQTNVTAVMCAQVDTIK